jgi:hypothetical protein
MALPNYYFKDQVLCYIARFHLTPWTLCEECEKTLKNQKIFEKIEERKKKFAKMGRKLMCGQHWISDKYVSCTAFSSRTGIYPDLVQYTTALFLFHTGNMNAFPLSRILESRRVTPNDIFLVELRHFFTEYEHRRVVGPNHPNKLSFFLKRCSPSAICAFLLLKASFPIYFVVLMKKILLKCEQIYYQYSEPKYVLFLYTEYVLKQCHKEYQKEFEQSLKNLKEFIFVTKPPPLPFYCSVIVRYFVKEAAFDSYPGPPRRPHVLAKPNTTTDKTSFSRSALFPFQTGRRGEIEHYFDTYKEMIDKLQYVPTPLEQKKGLSCPCYHCSRKCLDDIFECLQEAILQLKESYPKEFGHVKLSYEQTCSILEFYAENIHHVTPPDQRKVKKSLLAYSWYYIFDEVFNVVFSPQTICDIFSIDLESLHAAELSTCKFDKVNPTSHGCPSFLALFILLQSDVPLYIALLVKHYLSIIEHYFWGFEDVSSMVFFATERVFYATNFGNLDKRVQLLHNIKTFLFCMEKPFKMKYVNPLKEFFQCTLNVCTERHFLLGYQKYTPWED